MTPLTVFDCDHQPQGSQPEPIERYIYVSQNVKSLYYCGYGKNGLHGKDCFITNAGIEYLVLYG